MASLLGAQMLHFAAFPEHLREWVWAGAFFAVLAVAEWAAAWALLTRSGSRTAHMAMGLSLATVALWALSRTVGLPLGPNGGSPEPVGWADSICTALEMTTAVAAWRLAGWARRPADHTRRRFARALAIGAIAAVTTVGVLTPEPPHGRPMPTAEAVLPVPG